MAVVEELDDTPIEVGEGRYRLAKALGIAVAP